MSISPLRAAGELPDRTPEARPFRPWLLALLPGAGALVAMLLVRRVSPECGGAGEDGVIRAFHDRQGWLRTRVIWVKPLATLLTLATGGAGGREGPTALTGAAIGSAVARTLLERVNQGGVDQDAAQPRYSHSNMLRWARYRYPAFTGAVSLLAAVLLIGQQAQPDWLGWAVGAGAAVLLYAGRPRA